MLFRSQKLKVVYNTLLGQLWENRGDLPDEDGMLARREDYGTNDDGSPVEVPEGVLVLTCGVDTQDNRLEYEVVGHGYYGETFTTSRTASAGSGSRSPAWTPAATTRKRCTCAAGPGKTSAFLLSRAATARGSPS